MIGILAFIFFILGLIIGSFLNVVICRYNTHTSFGGRSACMNCRTTLCWYELIPLVSFFAQGGRCKSCQCRISWQYPLVEGVTAIIFGALFLKFQDLFFADTLVFAATYAFYGTLFALLVVISTYDIKHKIIPDALSFIFGLLAFIGLFFFKGEVFGFGVPDLWDFLAGFVVALPFALIWLVSRGTWMGLGDAKLAVGLGWMLGISMVLSGAVISFWSGAIIGGLLIFFSRKYEMKSEIPFAPFLVLGATIAFLCELHLFPINF